MLFLRSKTINSTRVLQRPFISQLSTSMKFSAILCMGALVPALMLGMHSSASAEEAGELKELPRAVLKHIPPVYKEWTFEKNDHETFPPGFHTETLGTGRPGEWTIVTEKDAPSPTHALRQASPCPSNTCFQLLLNEDIRTKYIDLSVQILSDLGTPTSGAGLIFNAQSKKNFLAVLVYPATNTVKVFEFIDGVATMLKEEAVIPQKRTRWHFLRVHLSSIVSREVVEVSFDNQFIMSIEPKDLKIGHLGLITMGDGTFAFDNLRAVELHTGNPISRPPAY